MQHACANVSFIDNKHLNDILVKFKETLHHPRASSNFLRVQGQKKSFKDISRTPKTCGNPMHETRETAASKTASNSRNSRIKDCKQLAKQPHQRLQATSETAASNTARNSRNSIKDCTQLAKQQHQRLHATLLRTHAWQPT